MRRRRGRGYGGGGGKGWVRVTSLPCAMKSGFKIDTNFAQKRIELDNVFKYIIKHSILA